MRILLFTGGAGQMYCGSCLRDNALASALIARGHDVVLTPVYTPTRTDERNVSHNRVAFGGISVFLEQHSKLFRHTPHMLDRLWDAEWIIKLASKRQIKVDPQSLGEITVSMLRGDQGFQQKEIAKLLDWLKTEPRFDVVNLPYTLLLGLAEPLKRTLGTPICCTLQGEDLFLDGLGEPWKQQSMDLIRAASVYVDAFLPVSRYYLDYMPGYLGIPPREDAARPARHQYGRLLASPAPRGRSRSRLATSRGLRRRRACTCSPMPIAVCVRGRASESPGSWPPATSRPSIRPTSTGITSDLNNWGLQGHFEYRGEVDRAQKIDFLRSLDVLSVPATYEEPKGIFLLEAMANGVPVVQPRRGAFPESRREHRWRPHRRGGQSRGARGRIPGALAGSRRAPRRSAPPERPACASTTASTAWPNRPKASTREVMAAARGSGEQHGVHVLSAKNISKSYPTPRGALTILSVMCRSRSIAATPSRSWGRRAAARARLLYILGALDAPSSGTVTIDGQDPFALGERAQAAFRNRCIGFVFQDHSLLPQCSVLENVLAPTLVAPPAEQGAADDRSAGRARCWCRSDWRPARSSSGRALWRREAARRPCPRADSRSAAGVVRRADR